MRGDDADRRAATAPGAVPAGLPDTSAASRVRAQIETSVRHTLREEARRNELGFAYARAALIAPAAVLAWVFDTLIDPGTLPNSWIDDATLSGDFVVSLVFLIALRRGWYHPVVRFLAPLADAAMVCCYFLLVHHLYGATIFVEYEIRTTLALVLATLSISGAARLDPKVAYMTTGLSIFVYAIVTAVVGWMQIDVWAAASLAAIGTLSIWLTRIVRRTAENEIARVMLRRFLPEGVVDSAHRDPLMLLGKPGARQVTIIVSDIRGFTTFAEATGAEEVFQTLNEVHGRLADVVQKHRGVVQAFTGDGMFAVFGLGEASSHALDAIAAVVAIRQAVSELRSSISASSLLDLRVGIGVHSGAVLVGCIGSETRLDWTVIGDTVNTTFRLQDLTKEFQVDVLVSSETVKLVGQTDHFQPLHFQPLGVAPIRGRIQKMGVFALGRADDTAGGSNRVASSTAASCPSG